MRFSAFFLLAAVFVLLRPAPAPAGEVVACGVPEAARLSTDPGQDYCNLHARRLAYRGEDIEFRKQIEARRENYLAPQVRALKTYEAEMEALNAERGDPANAGSGEAAAAE